MDIALVLEAEPLHFGALAGQGLIKMQQNEYEAAVAVFNKALDVNPWMANIVSNLKYAQQKLKEECSEISGKEESTSSGISGADPETPESDRVHS